MPGRCSRSYSSLYYAGATLLNDEYSGVHEQQLVAVLAVISGAFVALGWFVTARLLTAGGTPTRAAAILLLKVAIAAFGAFVAVTVLTAPSLPLLAALTGQDPADIALAREQFLKAREGPLVALVYLNAALTFTLVPYAMCLGFIQKRTAAWLLLALFLGYSVLFLEKAFFVRVIAPLAALLVVTRNRQVRLSWLLLMALSLLAANIALSGFAEERGCAGLPGLSHSRDTGQDSDRYARVLVGQLERRIPAWSDQSGLFKSSVGGACSS